MSNETSIGPARTPYNWRLLAILVAAILVSAILLTPYSLAIQGESLKFSPALLINWVVGTAQIGIMAAIGLAVASRIGLGLPFLESWLAGRPDWLLVRKFVLPAILTGVLAGIVVLGLDVVVFAPRIPELTQSGLKAPPAWAGFLASFYGGIAEEIQLRLFMLSLFAWIGRFVNRTPEGRPGLGALWVANVLTAVLFGLLHLPGTAAAGVPLDALVITRALVGNGLVGLVCGWLYWTFGLEAAMVSHFSADIVLHVISSLLAGQ
jgi:membrane protease YdiL (CAAX protease family)